VVLKSDSRLLLAKVESSYGADPFPTGTVNAMLVRWRDFPQPAPSDYVDRQLLRPYLGRSQQFKANSKVTLPIAAELAGSGAAGTAPAWGPLARMCGFAETINPGVSTVYNPISTGEESAAVYYWIGGIRQKALGCRGTLGLSFRAGEVPLINIDGTGLYSAPGDVTMLNTSWTAWKDPLVVNNQNTPTFRLGGYNATLRELTIDMGSDPVYRDWVNTNAVDLGNRTPGGSVTIEMPTIATNDFFAIDQAATPVALVLVHGTAAGSIIRIDAFRVQLMRPRYATEKGLLLLTMDLALLPSAGNDELFITVQ
jgi:hypothetical protein